VLYVVQAVALGAAVQAGIYEGQASELMVMDVWQASLMRAFATQLEREQGLAEGVEGSGSSSSGGGSGSSDEDEEGWEEEEPAAEQPAH